MVAVVGVLVLGLSLNAFRGLTLSSQPDRPPPQVIPAPPASVTAAAAEPVTANPAGLSAYSAIALGPQVRLRRGFALTPPYLPIDARTLTAGERRIALAGIAVPATAAVCLDEAGGRWICGIEARAAFYNFIRSDPLSCQPPLDGTRPPDRDGTLTVECRVRGHDLATELVRMGFARPAGLAGPDLAAALAEARAARRGLWRGNWQIVR